MDLDLRYFLLFSGKGSTFQREILISGEGGSLVTESSWYRKRLTMVFGWDSCLPPHLLPMAFKTNLALPEGKPHTF